VSSQDATQAGTQLAKTLAAGAGQRDASIRSSVASATQSLQGEVRGLLETADKCGQRVSNLEAAEREAASTSSVFAAKAVTAASGVGEKMGEKMGELAREAAQLNKQLLDIKTTLAGFDAAIDIKAGQVTIFDNGINVCTHFSRFSVLIFGFVK